MRIGDNQSTSTGLPCQDKQLLAICWSLFDPVARRAHLSFSAAMLLTLSGLCFFFISACDADLGSDVTAGEIWQTREEMTKITSMLDHLTKKVACQGEALEAKTEEVA